jgi:hypothetical protein
MFGNPFDSLRIPYKNDVGADMLRFEIDVIDAAIRIENEF